MCPKRECEKLDQKHDFALRAARVLNHFAVCVGRALEWIALPDMRPEPPVWPLRTRDAAREECERLGPVRGARVHQRYATNVHLFLVERLDWWEVESAAHSKHIANDIRVDDNTVV